VGAVHPAPASKELTKRILGSNQTTQERKISALNFCSGQAAPLWLRTCYDPALATQYEELETTSNVTGYLENQVLDNEALYGFEDGDDSWRRVLVRTPAYTEFIGARPLNEDDTNFQYNNGMTNEGILEQIKAVPEETLRELARISMQVQAVLYLVDREAITSGLVKVLSLHEHGEAVWDNRIEPGSLEDLTLALQDANRLDGFADGNRNCGDLLLL
jgi:hypothetical protein